MTTWDMLYTAEQMPDQVQIAAYMDNRCGNSFPGGLKLRINVSR